LQKGNNSPHKFPRHAGILPALNVDQRMAGPWMLLFPFFSGKGVEDCLRTAEYAQIVGCKSTMPLIAQIDCSCTYFVQWQKGANF
jgi:hypothetical protein